MKKFLLNPWTRRGIFAASLVPLFLLLCRVGLELLANFANIGHSGWLSANPVEFLEHRTGDWALRFLMFTLAITPLRKAFEQPLLIRFRRMLGLFAFFYACVHLLLYMTFDQMFDIKGVIADVIKRPYITVGMTGFLMMAPLAITSTAAMVRRVGPKRWQLLHRLVYFCALAGVIHFYWLKKSDVREPLMYGGILGVLMLYRVRLWLTKAPTTAKPTAVAV